MIANIILKREEILNKIEQAGIPRSNLKSVLLFGSNYWGYDKEGSDIDLHIILNEPKESVADFENLSLHYQETLEQTNYKIENGAWSTFYCINFASYLLFGERPKTSDFPKEKFVNSLTKWKETEWTQFSSRPRRWCFQGLMKRIYFLNYFYNNIPTFKITDFQQCSQLSADEIQFLETQYVKIFKHDAEDDSERDRIIEIIKKIEDEINSRI